MEYTNRMEFCVSCHEMQASYDEYRKTPHFQNASGVRAVCADCHVPREWGAKVARKVEATRDLYGHLTGIIDTPEKFEAYRLTMAKRVWARMTANDSQECRNCHSYPAMDFHKQSAKAIEQMQKAAETGETCISCHKGIAHKMPDMSQGIQLAFDELMAAAAKEGAKADTLYSASTHPLFFERPDGAPQGGGQGRLLSGSEVKVVARDGEWLKVRIEGWQQEGAERAIYALMGQRILTAALTGDAVGSLEEVQKLTDPATDLVWRRVVLVAWIGRDGMIGDRKRLEAYGAQLYTDACGVCHAPHAADHYLANQWIGTMNAMKDRTAVNDEQFRFLLKYLQMHASDTGGRRG